MAHSLSLIEVDVAFHMVAIAGRHITLMEEYAAISIDRIVRPFL
jgi:hypothetical protein